MPILFSVVARDGAILANFASCTGNFNEIVNQILCKIPLRSEKVTYSHGHYLFNYIAENRYLFFCITDKRCQRSKAFLFLNQIKRRFLSGEDNVNQMLAHEMYRYSEDYTSITVHKGEIDELNSIRVKSSEEILGEKILLVQNTECLNYGTISYIGKSPEQISGNTFGLGNICSDLQNVPVNCNLVNTSLGKRADIPIASNKSQINSTNNESEVSKISYKQTLNGIIIVAVILLGMAIYTSNFITSKHLYTANNNA